MRYSAHTRLSRTRAPLGVSTLCIDTLAFSARSSTWKSGSQTFISAGASVPGVIWNSILTPSTSTVWPVWSMVTLGGASVCVPSATDWPMPEPSVPSALFGK